MAPERRTGQRVRLLTASAATAGAIAGIALQRHHLRSIAADPDYAALSAPLGGRPLELHSRDGTRLHAELFGPDGGPTVVLAHGWTEQLAFWGPVIRLLVQRGLRVVAYDLRGHGRSGLAPDDDYTLDRFGEDVEAVLSATSPDGPVATVVGHSLGAMAIAAWASTHDARARARSAVLVNTGLGDLIAAQMVISGLAARFVNPVVGRAVLGSHAPIPSFSSPLQHAAIRFIAFGPTATAGQVAFYERMLVECPTTVRAATGVALSELELNDAAASLTIPTLVVAGDSDRLTPPVHARRIAAALPDPAGLIVFERTGHMSPLERPVELAEAIAALVADRAPDASPTAAGHVG